MSRSNHPRKPKNKKDRKDWGCGPTCEICNPDLRIKRYKKKKSESKTKIDLDET